ncbi:MAG TPA: hypothetical protein VF462_13450 [Micromonosporaceae bacterium]
MSKKNHQEVEIVFGLRRRKAHRDLVRAELGESFDHFRQAATHAASGVGATVGPRVQAARGHVGPAATRARTSAAKGWESTMVRVGPLAVAAVDGARQAGTVTRKAKSVKAMRKNKKARKSGRWSRLAGLAAAGAAVGAASAYALRRRNQPRWDEYDPAQALDAVRTEAGSAPGGVKDVPAEPGETTPGAVQATTTGQPGEVLGDVPTTRITGN